MVSERNHDALKVTIVAQWRQQKGSTSQDAFIAEVLAKYGVKLSARTLRSWCRELELVRPDRHTAQLRVPIMNALARLRTLEGELSQLLGSLEHVPAATPSHSDHERQPRTLAAANHTVASGDTTCGDAAGDPELLCPATPPSKDVPGSTRGSRRTPKKFVWDLDE